MVELISITGEQYLALDTRRRGDTIIDFLMDEMDELRIRMLVSKLEPVWPCAKSKLRL